MSGRRVSLSFTFQDTVEFVTLSWCDDEGSNQDTRDEEERKSKDDICQDEDRDDNEEVNI